MFIIENFEKSDATLNTALDLNLFELSESTLNTGYDFSDNLWEVIVKYNGNLEFIKEELDIQIEILSANYAILTLSAEKIDLLLNYRQIEYIEKPKLLELMLNNAKISSCITQITENPETPYRGKGVIVGIIDSGIDYTHPDFINDDGTTRILYIWDQTNNSGSHPIGFNNGTEYTSEEINSALSSPFPTSIVPETDLIGHGTAIAGIAAGNGRKSKGVYKGVASESSIIVVKLGETVRESFARSTEIMRAIKYILDKAIELNMPVAINLSYGTNSGSHSGDSLFETYVDDMTDIWKCTISVASGNEGSTGHHYENVITTGKTQEIEILVSLGLKSLFITLWKDFSDKFNFELISPLGDSTGIITYEADTIKYRFSNYSVYVNIGSPTPYSIDQQVFFEIISNTSSNVPDGIWRLKIYGYNVINGKYNIWLPVTETATKNTRFLNPSVYTTLTIPSTAKSVITVGGYNSNLNSISDFSGRGYTREYNYIKPDIVAPAYEITSPDTSQGYSVQTGTSIAAPFVTGCCAILMEWGIILGNDPFMYGQKLKAYLRQGATRDRNISYPDREWGYGKLCLRGTFNNLKLPNLITSTNLKTSSVYKNSISENIVYSEDYADFVVKLNDLIKSYIENNSNIFYCTVIDEDYAVVYIKKDVLSSMTFPENSYFQEPFLLGLMNTSALEASGILPLQTNPYLNLTGQGILVAIIDTGIDYTNDAFIYEDGTSKIYSIWDQTIEGNPPENFCYGSEYTNEQINKALKSETPFEIVPTTDLIGHGTFLASVSAGRPLQSSNFKGAAPDAQLIIVKLKEAKNYLRESKALYTSAPAYSSADLMQGINYVKTISKKLKKPISICIGIGTNEGSHNGLSVLEDYMTSIALQDGFIISCACGNEAIAKHHSIINLLNDTPTNEIELKVGKNEKGFTVNIWTYLPDKISVGLRSSLGTTVEQVQPIPNSSKEVNLVLENTKLTIEYPSSQFQGVGQQIKIKFISPSEGIWTIILYSDLVVNGIVHLWLPITNFITEDTFFLTSDPAYTTVVPATGRNLISVGGYNHITESIYPNSSRGPNTLNILNPLFVAPSVNVYGANPRGFAAMSGTSVASAITCGAGALLLEWGYTKGNDYFINTPNAASYFIRGTVRILDELYPNNIWGYGTLNLYNSFRTLI